MKETLHTYIENLEEPQLQFILSLIEKLFVTPED